MNRRYEREKAAKLIGIPAALFIVVFLLFLFWENQRILIVDVSECDTEASERITYKFEKIQFKADYLFLRGYAYEPGRSVDYADTSILAHDEDTGVFYQLPTENIKKKKLTEKANDGFNYDYAEFQSVTLRRKLPENFRLYILYRNNGENILIQTEQVLE